MTFEAIHEREEQARRNGKWAWVRSKLGWLVGLEDHKGRPTITADEHDELRHILRICKKEGIDSDALVRKYRKRVEQSKLAAEREARQAECVRAEQAIKETDELEGRRHREVLKKIEEMRDDYQRLERRRDESIEAWSDLLSDAEISAEERELVEELGIANKRVRELQKKLDPNGGPVAPYSPMLSTSPAALRDQTKAALVTRANSAEKTAELQKRLTECERAVREAQSELAALDKQRDSINGKLVKLNQQKMLPESFRLVTARPSYDELMQQNAKERNVHAIAPD